MTPINESQGNAPNNPTMVSLANLERRSLNLENQSNYAPVWLGWKKEQYQVFLRGLGLVTSLASFAVMVRNNYGYNMLFPIEDSNNFDDYDGYRYVLSAAIISAVYNIFQLLHRFCNGEPMFTRHGLNFLNLFGDQIVSYLLISAGSSAIQTTVEYKNSGKFCNSFTDSSIASIILALLAFLAMALSSIISAFKLSS